MRTTTKAVGLFAVLLLTAVSLWKLSGTESPKPRTEAAAPIAEAAPDDLDAVGPMMLELYTPYCPSCRQMAPLVDRLAGACPRNGVTVHQYDISAAEHAHLAEELEVRAVPTFVFIDETGTETSRLVGKQTEETLEAGLADIGGAACADRS